MRQALHWDVLFVLEHEELRRAPDGEHYRLARQLRRTLITQDRDYLDDRKFPPEQSGGVLVLWAPVEKGLMALLKRVDREVLRRARYPRDSSADEIVERAPAARRAQASRAYRLGRRENRAVIVVSGGDLILLRARRQRGLADHRRWPHRGDRVSSCRSGRGDDRRRDATATWRQASSMSTCTGSTGTTRSMAMARLPTSRRCCLDMASRRFARRPWRAAPDDLRGVLQQVRQARVTPVAGSARVLPAHLESNFINPEYKGAQPADCLRHAAGGSRDGVYSGATSSM